MNDLNKYPLKEYSTKSFGSEFNKSKKLKLKRNTNESFKNTND
jgi:hypothetical protein